MSSGSATSALLPELSRMICWYGRTSSTKSIFCCFVVWICYCENVQMTCSLWKMGAIFTAVTEGRNNSSQSLFSWTSPGDEVAIQKPTRHRDRKRLSSGKHHCIRSDIICGLLPDWSQRWPINPRWFRRSASLMSVNNNLLFSPLMLCSSVSLIYHLALCWHCSFPWWRIIWFPILSFLCLSCWRVVIEVVYHLYYHRYFVFSWLLLHFASLWVMNLYFRNK